MNEEQPSTEYWIFAVDLQKSIETIFNCSHREPLTPELLNELTATLWCHAKGCEVWRFLQDRDENQEIEIELVCGVNGIIWRIQYCGAPRSNDAKGKLSLRPLVPFLREQWNERTENSDSQRNGLVPSLLPNRS